MCSRVSLFEERRDIAIKTLFEVVWFFRENNNKDDDLPIQTKLYCTFDWNPTVVELNFKMDHTKRITWFITTHYLSVSLSQYHKLGNKIGGYMNKGL